MFAVIENYFEGEGEIDREMDTEMFEPWFARYDHSEDYVILVSLKDNII